MPSYIGLYRSLYSIGPYRPIYAYIGLYSIGCLQSYIGPTLVETLDLYVSSPGAMGIISKSVAHACSGGARGLLRPNDQEYGKGVVKFLPRSRETRDVRFRIQGTLLGFRA